MSESQGQTSPKNIEGIEYLITTLAFFWQWMNYSSPSPKKTTVSKFGESFLAPFQHVSFSSDDGHNFCKQPLVARDTRKSKLCLLIHTRLPGRPWITYAVAGSFFPQADFGALLGQATLFTRDIENQEKCGTINDLKDLFHIFHHEYIRSNFTLSNFGNYRRDWFPRTLSCCS